MYAGETGDVLGYVLGDGVTLVSSADECAKEVYTTLTDSDLVHAGPREASRAFLTTGSPEMFQGIGRRLMGGDFVFGVSEGYLIEGGKITAPVRGTFSLPSIQGRNATLITGTKRNHFNTQ